MAGVWTSVCVMFPALDAKAAGYKVYAVMDASGDPSEMASRTTLARFIQAGVIPTSTNAVLSETLALYNGLFRQIQIDRRLAPDLPLVRVDVEQIRRVVINLVDNGLDALGGSHAAPRPDGQAPTIVVESRHDASNGVARILVSDNGPGISAADRDKLFMPYYSTKRRGSGLGLAIVRRIIAEHGGSIEVQDNVPSGTVFTLELPL